MFYLSKVDGNTYYITDTEDNVTEALDGETVKQYIIKGIIIKGVALSLNENKKLYLNVSNTYTSEQIDDYIFRKPIYDQSYILAHEVLYFIKAINPQKVEKLGDFNYEKQTYNILLNATPEYISEQITYLEHMTYPAKYKFTVLELIKGYKKLYELKTSH